MFSHEVSRLVAELLAEFSTDSLSLGKPISKLPKTLTVDSSAPTAKLSEELAQATKYSVHRLRITKGSDGSPISSSTDTTIYSTGLRNQSTIYVKDLGPQISWLTVFVIEYIGPLLIHPLFYFGRPYIYGKSAQTPPSDLQTIFFVLICLHFLKREYETLFVHRFSLATMPFFKIFKNSAHYWVLAGLNIAPWIYYPSAPTATNKPDPFLLYPGLILYVIGEIGTFSAHQTLRNLRSLGGKERGIPRGFFFDLVTCPNYMFEVLVWIGLYLISGLSWSIVVFLAIGVAQMALWAKKKEKIYRAEFPDKYKRKRYVMLPGLY